MTGDKTEALELVMLADQLARELINDSAQAGWSSEAALQVVTMAAMLIRRTQPSPQRAVAAMLEAEATLALVSGDLVAN